MRRATPVPGGRAAARIGEFLACELRLRLHERKLQVRRCRDGVTFLGWRLMPGGRARLVRANVVRMRRRLRGLAREYHAGAISFEEVGQVVQAWLGHAAFGNTWRLRAQLFGAPEVRLRGAERGRNAGRVLEQQSRERPRLEP